MSAKRVYTPPIPWARLDAMIKAVFDQRQSSKQIDAVMLTEIMDALYALRGIYQAELARTLPPHTTPQRVLVDAAVIRYIMETFEATLPEAHVAAMGAALRVEADSARKTYNARNRILGPSGIGGITDMRPWITRVRWAARRARRMGLRRKH